MADPHDIATRWMMAFNAHDEASMDALTAEDARLIVPPEETIEGREAVTAYAMTWLNAFPDSSATVHHETATGPTVVQEFTFEGTHRSPLHGPQGDIPPTGRQVKGRGIQVVEVHDDLIHEIRLYFDQVQLMTQLGVMPVAAQH